MAQRKLFRKAEEKLFKKHGCQDGKGGDAIVVARLFHPCSSHTWYITECDEQDYLFGFTVGEEMEWGTIGTREQMENVTVRGLKIERDNWFTPCTLKEALEKDGKKYPY
jgi:hypothetical protein